MGTVYETNTPPFQWSDLDYWKTGEWQVCDEELKRLDKAGVVYCPGREHLFAALDLCPYDLTRVVLCGQDPYPNPNACTGLAFSVPESFEPLPLSLVNILKELIDDYPDIELSGNGDISRWAREEGVLLWNAIPSCEAWKSKSHHWPEYELLTAEIFQRLSQKHVVFAFLGSTAAYYKKYVNEEKSDVICVTHPSPRALLNKNIKPFFGCRLFSTINTHLDQLGFEPVDWRV